MGFSARNSAIVKVEKFSFRSHLRDFGGNKVGSSVRIWRGRRRSEKGRQSRRAIQRSPRKCESCSRRRINETTSSAQCQFKRKLSSDGEQIRHFWARGLAVSY